MADAERIFERQGVKLSEGITRLIRHLVDSPDELKPLILDQAYGDAALALAASVLKRARVGGEMGGYAGNDAEPIKSPPAALDPHTPAKRRKR